MSVETLHASELIAGREIGLSEQVIDEIIDAQQTRIFDLGELVIRTDNGDTRLIKAARGISGPDNGSMDKGGSRMTSKGVQDDLDTLPQDMWAKLHQGGFTDIDGKPLNGGKLLFDVDPNSLSHTEKIHTFAAAAEAMLNKGIAGHRKSVPAGDMGTNHSDYMDAFASIVRASGDPHWRGSITGKSVPMGGLEFRPHATGYGVYLSVDHQREQLELDVARITISGAGNVGGYLGYYASQDEQQHFNIRGYSDLWGTLVVESEEGMQVTDELLDIMDNPNFSRDLKYAAYEGNKLAAMRDVLARTQPNLKTHIHDDPDHIMEVPTDIFVPASVRNLINQRTAPKLAALAVNEAGNDTITGEGYAILATRGISIIPGTIANAGGVATSMDEQKAGIRGTTLSFKEAKGLATESALSRLARMEAMAKQLGTTDYQLAACALGMAGMAIQLGHSIDARVATVLRPYALVV